MIRPFTDLREKPLVRVEGGINGTLDLRGCQGVYVGRHNTYCLCQLTPVHQKDVSGGIWKIIPRLERVDFFNLLAQSVATKDFARCVTDFKGEDLVPAEIPDLARGKIGLSEGTWFASPWGLVITEALKQSDEVRLIYCYIVRRGKVAYLRQVFLKPDFVVDYHSYNGDLSKLVAIELGEKLAPLSDVVITTLNRAHSRQS